VIASDGVLQDAAWLEEALQRTPVGVASGDPVRASVGFKKRPR
jgi:hypothetical protein